MSELSEIGTFQVTDRSLADVEQILDVDFRDRSTIPLSAVILNVGSGLHRLFEKQLTEARSDLNILSIDPSLGLASIDHSAHPLSGFKITELDPEIAIYDADDKPTIHRGDWILRGEKAAKYDSERRLKATMVPGAIAALASDLPIKDECIDVIIDTLGPIQYIKNIDTLKKYLLEIKRVLKKSGKAYVSSLSDDAKKMLPEIGLRSTQTDTSNDDSFILARV